MAYKKRVEEEEMPNLENIKLDTTPEEHLQEVPKVVIEDNWIYKFSFWDVLTKVSNISNHCLLGISILHIEAIAFPAAFLISLSWLAKDDKTWFLICVFTFSSKFKYFWVYSFFDIIFFINVDDIWRTFFSSCSFDIFDEIFIKNSLKFSDASLVIWDSASLRNESFPLKAFRRIWDKGSCSCWLIFFWMYLLFI